MIKFVDLKSQYSTIKREMDAEIFQVIEESAFIGGEQVRTFEKSFAEYQNVKHCVGVANGTDAIEIAIEALNLPPGSEVLVPANTFIATSESVTRSGHQVVFCDCDPENYTFSVADARKRLSSKTKAMMVVHLYGHPSNMDEVMAFAREHHLKVIEDCAQAHGAEFKGQRVGTFGEIGTFSFYPGKNLGAYGDAGAIVCKDDALALKCRMIANHGRTGKYDHAFEGRNSRLDGIQAAVLNVKLRHLETWTEKRISLARLYQELLKDCRGITLPKTASWARAVFHLFVIRTARRDALQAHLKEMGIETGVHYPISLPKLPAYAHMNQSKAPFFANETDGTLLSLPIGEHLSEEQVRKVAEAVLTFMNAS